MSKNLNKLQALLMLVLFVALMKLVVEKALYSLDAISTDAVKIVSMSEWILIAVLSFLFLKGWLVAYRDNQQSEHASQSSGIHHPLIRNTHESGTDSMTVDFKNFLWHMHVILPKGRTLEEYQNGGRHIREVELEDVRGPYCPHDEYKMTQKRTYLGKYQFRCPHCNYKNKTIENEKTLIDGLKRLFDSKMIKEGSHNKSYKEKITMRKLQ